LCNKLLKFQSKKYQIQIIVSTVKLVSTEKKPRNPSFDIIIPQVYHYLERLIHHAENNKEKLFDLQIADSLSKIFPQV
jgi:hypothetical protein